MDIDYPIQNNILNLMRAIVEVDGSITSVLFCFFLLLVVVGCFGQLCKQVKILSSIN